MKLTNKQKKWLITRGGRTYRDVVTDNGKLYVVMSTFCRDLKLYKIPNDKNIKIYKDKGGYIRTGTDRSMLK